MAVGAHGGLVDIKPIEHYKTAHNTTKQNSNIVLFIDRNKNKRRNSAKYFSFLFQFFSHPKILLPFFVGIKGNGKCIEH